MTKRIVLFWVVLAWGTATCQQRSFGKDTVAISFSLLDWHRGDTIYAHVDSPRTIMRYFNKNLRGIFHGDTIITGGVILSFILDQQGKYTEAFYDTSRFNPELVGEVMRVVVPFKPDIQLESSVQH